MRNLETFNTNSSFYTKLTNNAFFCIDDELVESLGVAVGFKLNNARPFCRSALCFGNG